MRGIVDEGAAPAVAPAPDGQHTARSLEAGQDIVPADRRPSQHPDTGSQVAGQGGGYYDVPMLKAPVWSWEIPTYFYLGGLSAGAFVIARMAERFGGHGLRQVTRSGTAVAAAALLPCPYLLIRDLGDRRRFHFMLRVFKPRSPMNLGAWTLTGYSGAVAAAGLRELLKRAETGRSPKRRARERSQRETTAAASNRAPVTVPRGSLGRSMLQGADIAGTTLLDAAGVPLALLLAGYTGVLLSTSNTPVWARNPWIGPLFSAGAISAGAEAVNLALEVQEKAGASIAAQPVMGAAAESNTAPVRKLGAAARMVEAVALTGYLTSAGALAKPLTTGEQSRTLWGGVVGAGLVVPALVERLPVRSARTKRWLRIGAAVTGLAGGFALRWAITRAGRASASDPSAARETSK